jgi:hypothetical protein
MDSMSHDLIRPWIARLALCAILAGGSAVGQVPPPDPAPAVVPTPAPPAPPAPPGRAKAVITTRDGKPVPETWPLGTSLTLSAGQSTAGREASSIDWELDPAWVDAHSDRDQANHLLYVALGTGPKTIKIRLTVAKGDTLDKAVVTVRAIRDPSEPVDPDGPQPVPPGPQPLPPGPAPQPTPNPAPDNLGVRAASYRDLAVRLVPASPTRATTAKAIATVYEQAAGKIAKAVATNPPSPDLVPYTTAGGITQAVGRPLLDALGGDVDAWRPFFKVLKDDLTGMKVAGQLAGAGDHIPVFLDVAAGLRAVP